MNDLEVLAKVKAEGICAIIRKLSPEQAIKTTAALIDGGVSVIEVAFNTAGAAQIISELKQAFGEKVTIGAGTVLDSETARIAILAGANFILSPTLNLGVLKICQKYNVLAIPGVYTPTEMVNAWENGARMVKIFPAVTVGPNFIRQVKGPLDQLDIMAVGGINAENTADFLKAGASCVGIGSEIAGQKLVALGGYQAITDSAKQYQTIIQKVKN